MPTNRADHGEPPSSNRQRRRTPAAMGDGWPQVGGAAAHGASSTQQVVKRIPTTSSQPSTPQSVSGTGSGNGGDTSTACIIAFEVIFSVFVFGVVAGCYIFGMRRRRRQRQLEHERGLAYAAAQTACSASIIERAFERHERGLPRMTDSTHSSTTCMLPPYFPPDSTLRLPDQAVARLSQAMLMAHVGRTHVPQPLASLPTPHADDTSSTSSVPPPKYSAVVSRPPTCCTRSRTPSYSSS